MQHLVTVDQKPLKKKPEGREVGYIKSRFQQGEVDSVRDFIDVIAEGRSWAPPVFEGNHPKNDNFISQSIFALDYDSGISPQTVIDKLRGYGIEPNAYYNTFSHTEETPKFRLVLFLDRKITDQVERDWYQKSLLKMFPSADQSTGDSARFYYGGNGDGFVLSEELVSAYDLGMVLKSDAVKNGGRFRKIGKSPDVKGGYNVYDEVSLEEPPIINIIGDMSYATPDDEQRKRYWEKLKSYKTTEIDWKALEDKVQIFHDFMHREERLKFAELKGLCLNMVWMKGGKTIYENRLKDFNENYESNDPDGYYKEDGRHELARVLTRENKSLQTYYSPMKLENFSPYKEDHKYRTLYEADREFIDGVEVTEPINRMTLPKAQQLFEYQYNRCLKEHNNDIHIFKVHTALGKTEHIKESGSNILLCFPTHQLKDEVYERRNGKHSAIKTPQLPTFESDELNQKLSRLYELGFRGAAYKKLVEVAHQITSDTYTMYDRNKAAKYLKRQKEIRVTDKTILTTHDWAIHSGGNLEYVDQCVYDEDPIESLAAVESIKISDLVKMAGKVGEGLFRDGDTKISDLVSYLMSEVEEGEITELPDRFDLDLKEDINVFSQMEGLSSNVVQFFESDYLYREDGDPDTIHYINTKYFPDDKKIIVLSASANIPFYEEMYGKNRVNVYDISDIHQKGEVHQHLNKSFSRTSLKSSIDEANELTADKPTITFMTLRDEIDTAVDDIYFGNCSGYDQYSGQDLNICGTNHKSNSLYYLLGAVLNIPIKHPKDREFGKKTVEFNGLKFSFSTFLHNERLSQLQLAIIHGESVQAVGRSRTLRYDCRMDLYSNLPIRQAAPNFHF